MLQKLVLIVLLLTSTVEAASWQTYAHDDQATVYAYESRTITHHEAHGLVLVVWTRRQDVQLRTRVSKTEVHCPSASTRTVYQVTGTAQEVTYELTDAQAAWRYALPDTPEMALTQHVCTYYK